MALTVVLIIGSLQVLGNLKLSLDMAQYPRPDSGTDLELSYEIPLTSLVFLRYNDSFAARFDIAVQLLDQAGNPLAGDIWQLIAKVPEYDYTVERDSTIAGTVSIMVPAGATRCRVQVSDYSSDRVASTVFELEAIGSKLLVRLLRAGRPNPTRTYRLGDTLEALAQLVAPSTRADSFRFLIRNGSNKVVTAATLVPDSQVDPDQAVNRYSNARYRIALTDSAGKTRMPGGTYSLEATAFGPHAQTNASRIDFRIDAPFYLDDQAYRQKVEELVYIATAAEMAELKRRPREEREQAWNDFWKKKDPTPTTARNEREEEYFARIDYAKEHFGGADRGFKSDRGRVYVRYGPPDNIDSRPFELDVRASETWYYYDLGLEFLFVDRYGFGEYVLTNPGALNDN
ncbi:MAG: GWxTD domain-containing protein [candidate division WOR-3 bacterium]